MSKDDWKKLSYTDEESEELERLSMLGGAGNIDAHVADKILCETMRKYESEKEKTIMSNTTNFEKALGKKNANMGEAIANTREDLGKQFANSLIDACKRFTLWMETSQCVLKALNTLKENDKVTKELDETMIELTKVTDKTVEELENLK